jgi:hypothetical protein
MSVPARAFAAALLCAGCAAPAAAPAAAPPESTPPTSLRILPSRVLLEQGESLRFHAVDDAGRPVTVRWSVVQGTSEGPPTYDAGSVDADGIYVPGVLGYWNHVQATATGAPELVAVARVQVVPRGGLPLREERGTGGPTAGSRELKAPWGSVFFPGDLEADATRVARWTADAIDILRAAFREDVPAAVWQGARLSVELHDERGRFPVGNAEIVTSWEEGVCTARVGFLAPLHHAGTWTEGSGEPFGEAYFRKLLVHEFASVALEATTYRKPGGGWTIYDAPPWFVHGLEERLALVLATPGGGRKGLAHLRGMARREPERAGVEEGVLRLRDPYVDGTVFVDFLATRGTAAGGKDAIRSLLLSPRPGFAAAFEEVFGATPAALLPEFRAWLARG